MGELIPHQRLRILPRRRADERWPRVAPSRTTGSASAGRTNAGCTAARYAVAKCAVAGYAVARWEIEGYAVAGRAIADNGSKPRLARTDPKPPAPASSL